MSRTIELTAITNYDHCEYECPNCCHTNSIELSFDDVSEISYGSELEVTCENCGQIYVADSVDW